MCKCNFYHPKALFLWQIRMRQEPSYCSSFPISLTLNLPVFGLHTKSYLTIAPAVVWSDTFHNKQFNFFLPFFNNFLGENNKHPGQVALQAKQYWFDYLQSASRGLIDQELIFVVILSTEGLYSFSVDLPNIKGTPRYLTGSFPSLN